MAKASERQIHETIARCVGIMVFYRNVEKTAKTRAMMTAEVQAIAGWVGKLNLDSEAVDAQILRPLEAEFLARYGTAAGGRLNAEFIEAFGRSAMFAVTLTDSRGL